MIIKPQYAPPAPVHESENAPSGVCAAKSGLRYYSPTLGRFINKDPIEERGGLNLYAFCGNNGVNKWDYLGQAEGEGWQYQSTQDVDGNWTISIDWSGGLSGWDMIEARNSAAKNVSFSAYAEGVMADQRAYVDAAARAGTNGKVSVDAITLPKLVVTATRGDNLEKAINSAANASVLVEGMTGTIPIPMPAFYSDVFTKSEPLIGGLIFEAPALIGTVGTLVTVAGAGATLLNTPILAPNTFNRRGAFNHVFVVPNTEMGSYNLDSTDNQVKRLSPGEIQILIDAGIDPHDLKPSYQGSRYDIFKDASGNLEVRPKDGTGPGEQTGHNINDVRKSGNQNEN